MLVRMMTGELQGTSAGNGLGPFAAALGEGRLNGYGASAHVFCAPPPRITPVWLTAEPLASGRVGESLGVLRHKAEWPKIMRMPTERGWFSALPRSLASRSGAAGSASKVSSSPGTQDPVVSYLKELLAETREELNRVDSKAALLLAGSGVIIGALLAGLFGGRWTPFELNSKIEWLWWLGIALAAAGVFSIAAAVYPTIHTSEVPRPGTPSYYGDVAAYKDVDAFRRSLEEKPPEPRDRLIDQTFVLSNVVRRKYVLLRRGLRCLLLAIITCVASVVINIPISR